MPDTVLSAWHVLSHFRLTIDLVGAAGIPGF